MNKSSLTKTILKFSFVALLFVCVTAIVIYKRGAPVYTYVAWSGPVKECTYLGSRKYNNVSIDFSNCGAIDAKGNLHLDQKVLHSMKFNRERPECIRLYLDKTVKYFYVDKVNNAVETMQNYSDDPDCDDYSEGLVRSPSPEGMRFVDRSLHVVISTSYQYVFRFKDGHAAVCNDLRVFIPFYDEDMIGEYVGGHCGYIDRRGALVVPMDYKGNDFSAHEPLSTR